MSLSNYPRRDNSFGIDMDKRDSLSDKIVKIADDISPKPAISKHDVKEFIKNKEQRMMEECDEEGRLTVNQCLEIDKEIFGKELTE